MQTVPPDRRAPLILSETLKVNWCCKGQVSLEIKCSTKLELGRCMMFTFLAAIWRRLSLFVQLYSLLFENHCLEWKKNKTKKPCDLCLGDSGRQILEFLKSVQFWEMLRNVTLVIAVLFLPFDFFFFPSSLLIARCIWIRTGDVQEDFKQFFPLGCFLIFLVLNRNHSWLPN